MILPHFTIKPMDLHIIATKWKKAQMQEKKKLCFVFRIFTIIIFIIIMYSTHSSPPSKPGGYVTSENISVRLGAANVAIRCSPQAERRSKLQRSHKGHFFLTLNFHVSSVFSVFLPQSSPSNVKPEIDCFHQQTT